jgi:hypothetical protein
MAEQVRAEEQIIEEVRHARAEIWHRAGGSGAGLMRLLQTSPRRPAPMQQPGPAESNKQGGEEARRTA